MECYKKVENIIQSFINAPIVAKCGWVLPSGENMRGKIILLNNEWGIFFFYQTILNILNLNILILNVL